MEKTMKTTESSLLYRKIDELALTPRARAEAVAALESAERITETFLWVASKFRKVAVVSPMPTTLKHQ